MVEHNEPPVHVNGTSGVQSGHEPQHVTVKSITILVHKFLEIPSININMNGMALINSVGPLLYIHCM